MKKITAFFTVFFTFSTHTFATQNDIFPENTSQGSYRYVQVTLSAQKQWVKFEDCKISVNPQADQDPLLNCRVIGNQEWYHLTSLKNQRRREHRDFLLKLAGGAATLAAGTYVGFLGGALAIMGGAGKAAVFLGAGSGLTSSALLIKKLQGINPVEQAREVLVLLDSVILDQDVETDDIDSVVQTLERVLNRT